MSSSQTPPSKETQVPDTAADHPETQPAGNAPFQRGQIVWGRPPQAVFRAGPLPRDEGLARLLAMPPHPAPPKPMVRGSQAAGGTKSIVGGSNIPQGAPRQAVTAGAKPATVSGAGLMSGSLVPGAGMARPQPAKPQEATQPTVSAKPAQSETPVVEPTITAPATTEIQVDSVLEPVVASSSRRVRPAVDVTEDTTQGAVDAQPLSPKPSRKKPSRLIMAATAALVVAAGGAAIWWSQKGHPDNPPFVEQTAPPVAESGLPQTSGETPDPAPAAVDESELPAPETTASSQSAAPAPGANAQPAPAAPTASPPARPQPVPNRPASASEGANPSSAQAPVQVPAQDQATVPVVTVTPPPTAAAPQQNDPDAPVVTRPQKLD